MKYEDYEPYCLGDVYLRLISFIASYITQNYDPMEVFKVDYETDYAFAQRIMKDALKAILDEIKKNGQIHLNTLNKTVGLYNMTMNDQIALENEIMMALTQYVNENIEKRKSIKR